MLIYAVADIHGKRSHLLSIKENIAKHNPDILVVAGDVTRRFSYRKTLNFLNNLGIPAVIILGNSDWSFIHKIIERKPNLINLNLRNYFGSNFTFTGISGTIPLPFKNMIAFKERKRLESVAEFMKKETVFVVHPPPYGVLDKVLNRYHTGSMALREFVETHQPQLVLCGHIHEQPGRAFIGESMIVNCAMNRKSEGAIVKLGKDHMPKVELLMAEKSSYLD